MRWSGPTRSLPLPSAPGRESVATAARWCRERIGVSALDFGDRFAAPGHRLPRQHLSLAGLPGRRDREPRRLIERAGARLPAASVKARSGGALGQVLLAATKPFGDSRGQPSWLAPGLEAMSVCSS